jgi:hypothetical protein
MPKLCVSAAAIRAIQVSNQLRSTVITNQRFVSAGTNYMLLNGMLVEVKNFELFSELATPSLAALCQMLGEW